MAKNEHRDNKKEGKISTQLELISQEEERESPGQLGLPLESKTEKEVAEIKRDFIKLFEAIVDGRVKLPVDGFKIPTSLRISEIIPSDLISLIRKYFSTAEFNPKNTAAGLLDAIHEIGFPQVLEPDGAYEEDAFYRVVLNAEKYKKYKDKETQQFIVHLKIRPKTKEEAQKGGTRFKRLEKVIVSNYWIFPPKKDHLIISDGKTYPLPNRKS